MNRIFAVLLFFFCAYGAMGSSGTIPHDPTWQQISSAPSVAKQLVLIDQKGRLAKNLFGNQETLDSIAEFLIHLQSSSLEFIDHTRVVDLYLKYGPLLTKSREAHQIVGTWQNNTPDFPNKTWYLHQFKSRLYNVTYKFDKAVSEAQLGLETARILGDSALVGRSFSQLALTCENNNQKVPALTYFLVGEEILKKYGSKRDLFTHYDELRDFYIQISEYDEAIGVLSLQETLLASSDEFDLLDSYYVEYWKLYASTLSESVDEYLSIVLDRILKYDELGYEFLLGEYLSLYRTQLIRNNDFQGLYELYRDIIPDELEDTKTSAPHTYYRLRAYFKEAQGQIDSAAYFWQKSSAEMARQPDLYRKANFYIRMGEFYERQGEYDKAAHFLEISAQYSRESRFIPFLLRAVNGLERLRMAEGDFESAYALADERHTLEDSIQKINEKEKLALAEVLHEMRLEQSRQAAQLRTELLRSRSFGFGFALFVLLSGLIFYQFHQTRKEKQRSDSLLLNILPAETADELKEKGKTTARRFEQVTILFADFVGFTKLSEQLSPGELVAEIDHYFRSFDEICQTFGLEKIKTIGDAYLAVGGMPNENKATASDVVKAALAMRNAVTTINAAHPGRSLAVRIGLHTGEVVAGVVGTMKFQYDVWGDAVNTAARMEQNSKPGKVNISRSTLDLLDDSFETEHRGRIEAKNKGHLEMYFVELNDQ